MGVEVAGSDVAKVNGEVNGKLHEPDNVNIDFSEVITFGSHEVDEPQPKGEATDVSTGNFPKNAVDEWPEAKQTHYFWFVKYRPLEDPSLKAKLDQADREIQKKKQQIDQIYEELNAKKSQKYELINELKSFKEQSSQYRAFINEKREEIKPLQNALGSLRGGGGGERGYGICSSEEELNQKIRGLEYQMQHESLSLKEEKQLLRDIKELEATRPKVVANSAVRAKIQESMGQKEAIQDQVKLLGTDLDGVRKQQEAVNLKKGRLNTQLDALKAQITALETEISNAKDKKKAAYDTIVELRKKRDDGNALFYESRAILNNAKQIAIKKDVKALEELSISEVEKFMLQWNSNKAFRDDYEKRILPSLDYRQLSRDGRMRNFDEKPLMKAETPSEPDVVSQATSKQPKEVAKSTPKAEELPAAGKAQKESKKGSKESKIAPVQAPEEEEEIFVVGKPKKDVSTDNVDAAKLKELKREEEMEKQRQAMERKKKQQEKNAAKAALRAQKEAEKKLKEREKKQRKKGAPALQAADEEEPTEKSDADEPEKVEEVEEAVVAPTPSKAKAGNALKHRKTVKPRSTLPKANAILKKKKSDKYWLWGYIAAGVVGVLLLLVLGYKFLL